MHSAIASQLDIPDYYGNDLDALYDCLSDLEIPPDAGLALVSRDHESRAMARLCGQVAASQRKRQCRWNDRCVYRHIADCAEPDGTGGNTRP
jgi:hypothetical protein